MKLKGKKMAKTKTKKKPASNPQLKFGNRIALANRLKKDWKNICKEGPTASECARTMQNLLGFRITQSQIRYLAKQIGLTNGRSKPWPAGPFVKESSTSKSKTGHRHCSYTSSIMAGIMYETLDDLLSEKNKSALTQIMNGYSPKVRSRLRQTKRPAKAEPR
jgi:hypothetical protein